MTEKSFQTTMIKAFRAAGYYADNMEVQSAPGWPDIYAASSHRHWLVEVKARKIGPQYTVKGLFSPAQLPWWLHYVTVTKATNLWLVVKTPDELMLHRVYDETVWMITHDYVVCEMPWETVPTAKEAVRRITQ
jgi:hypothetical protein